MLVFHLFCVAIQIQHLWGSISELQDFKTSPKMLSGVDLGICILNGFSYPMCKKNLIKFKCQRQRTQMDGNMNLCQKLEKKTLLKKENMYKHVTSNHPPIHHSPRDAPEVIPMVTGPSGKKFSVTWCLFGIFSWRRIKRWCEKK